ncbi:MAG: hydroxyacid dehydrogenase [Bacteroidales bacterium]|nr:hydroxyacid dehydrogenase [Bacteroidales bacterium]
MSQGARKILLIDLVHPIIPEELSRHGFSCDFFPDYGREDFLRVIDQYTGVIVRSKIRLDNEFLSRASKLKFIGRVGSGLENIDVACAQKKGILCLNSPEGNRDAVAEHAVGMLLAMMNNINRADKEVRSGRWIREGNRGNEIKGKTVGIIGYGNTGSAFARRLKGFEANVISFDTYKTNYSDGNTRETTLQEICDTADILSLHVPLTEETEFMVDATFIQKFRKPFWLINTSRGKVVRTADLAEALKSGKVRGAALDVLEYEDSSFETLSRDLPRDFRYLMEAENVILTPHIAGWTHESNVRLAEVLVEKVLNSEIAK